MKKSILYIIIVVLLCVISSGVTYIIMDSKDKEVVENDNKEDISNDIEDKEQENIKEEIVLKDGVELVDTYKENDKIIQEFKVVLNGQEKIMKVTNTFEFNFETGFYIIEGIYNKVIFNCLEIQKDSVSNNIEEAIFNVNNINKGFNEDNFRIIMGKDNKKYLLVIYYGYEESLLYVFNEELEIISKNAVNGVHSNWLYDGFVINSNVYEICEVENGRIRYEDQFNIYLKDKSKSHCSFSRVKIDNDKIYYLARVSEDIVGNDYEVVEERVYTINKDRLEYEVINTYKNVKIINQI